MEVCVCMIKFPLFSYMLHFIDLLTIYHNLSSFTSRSLFFFYYHSHLLCIMKVNSSMKLKPGQAEFSGSISYVVENFFFSEFLSHFLNIINFALMPL